MTVSLVIAVIASLAALSADLERGFRARVARRLRDKEMPVVEIAEVLDVTRASVYRYLSETEGNES